MKNIMKKTNLAKIRFMGIGVLTAGLCGVVILSGSLDSKVIARQGLLDSTPLFTSQSGFSNEVSQFIYSQVANRLPLKFKHSSKLVANQILKSSLNYKLDPLLLLAVIQHESKFAPTIIGDAGEIGLMQIKPTTATWMAQKLGKKWNFNGANQKLLFNPAINIQLGAAYLAQMQKRFPAHGSLFLSAYNMGTSNVLRNLASQRLPYQYSSKVMVQYYEIYRTLKAQLRA